MTRAEHNGAMPTDTLTPAERRESLDPVVYDLLDSFACIIADGDADETLETFHDFWLTVIQQLRALGFDPADEGRYVQNGKVALPTP